MTMTIIASWTRLAFVHGCVCCTMRPSRASTSLTRVPFASPPMLGLQLISPMLAEGRGVTSNVLAPRLADAAAASQPARQHQVSTGRLFDNKLAAVQHSRRPRKTCSGDKIPAWPPPTITTSTSVLYARRVLPKSCVGLDLSHVRVLGSLSQVREQQRLVRPTCLHARSIVPCKIAKKEVLQCCSQPTSERGHRRHEYALF